MSLKEQTVQALGDLLQDRLTKAGQPLTNPITILDAPPSEAAEYPAMAIEINHTRRKWLQKTEITKDANGNPRTGAAMTIDDDMGAAQIDSKTQLVRVGTLYVSGKIWLASRLPPQRSAIEDIVESIFNERMAPGSLLFTLQKPMVGGKPLPWDWTAAVFLGDTEWSDEFGWSERLWAWMDYDIEMDMLVASNSPLVTTLHLVVDMDTVQPTSGDTVVDLDGGIDSETYAIDQSGNITPVP